MTIEGQNTATFSQTPIEQGGLMSQNQAADEEIQKRGVFGRIKQGIGRAALVLSLTTGGVATTAAAEIATGNEATAQAEAPNGAELAWCRWPSRYALCVKANRLGDTAFNASEQVAADTKWSLADGGADAVRHCYWNALMTKEFGRSTASGFGWRHEYNENFGTPESNMDLHNNLKGRDYASFSDPLQKCVDGVNNGQLIRLEF